MIDIVSAIVGEAILQHELNILIKRLEGFVFLKEARVDFVRLGRVG